MKKYDIYVGDFNPRKGSTQSGVRPCVIIQSNLFNGTSPTILVIPLTSVVQKVFPSEFTITPSERNGLKEHSRFLGSQIITLDVQYLSKKLGRLEEKYQLQVREALGVALDIEDDF